MADEQISRQLNEIGEVLRNKPSLRSSVMERVTRSVPPRPVRTFGRIGRALAIAACAVIAVTAWNTFVSNGRSDLLGAQAAFAAAIDNVAKAQSFSARQISTSVGENGEIETREMAVMFSEPNLERIEYLKGLPAQVTITDYAKRRSIVLLPDDKSAHVRDIRDSYTIDEKSGTLVLTKLETDVRDQVLKITAEAVKDLGISKLHGKDVRVLQSEGGEPVKTVYVDPATNAPVQIEMNWPSSKATFTYASIQIDTALDAGLFSLEVPAGYASNDDARQNQAPPKDATKMLAKMKHLVMQCYAYSAKHNNEFPDKLDDLKPTMNEKALKALLAAPEVPDGPPVIEYRKPRKGKDSGTEIVVYESAAFRKPGFVVAGMWDGHAEILTQDRFEELMK